MVYLKRYNDKEAQWSIEMSVFDCKRIKNIKDRCKDWYKYQIVNEIGE